MRNRENIRQVLSTVKKKVEGPDVNIECCCYNNGIILYQFKEQKILLTPYSISKGTKPF